MKTNDKKKEFVELRAKGYSFDKISNEIDVSKPTLIKWNQELYKDISNLEYLEMQALLEEFSISKKKKMEVFSKKLQEINEAIEKIDPSSLNLKELISLKHHLEAEIENEKRNIKFYTGEFTDPFDMDLHDEVILRLKE